MLRLDVRNRGMKFDTCVRGLDFYRAGAPSVVALAAKRADEKGLAPPFMAPNGYMDEVILPAINVFYSNSKSRTADDLIDDLANRVLARGGSLLVDFPDLRRHLEFPIPSSWMSCDEILGRLVGRAEIESQRFRLTHQLGSRTQEADSLVVIESSDDEIGLQAYCDRATGTITIKLNPAHLTYVEYELIDMILVHEDVSHLTAGPSIQESDRGEWAGPAHMVSAFFDGFEFQVLLDDYPGIRFQAEEDAPPVRELCLLIESLSEGLDDRASIDHSPL